MEKFSTKLVLCLILALLSLNSQGVVIISDLDDTIKITNTRDTSARNYNALFNSDAFLGMSDLMSQMETYTNGLYYVSASPKLINSRIQRFFRKNDLNVSDFYTRRLSDLGDKEGFKMRSISQILDQTGEDVILIGDDSEADELVYTKIKNLYPDRVLATYIHNVYNEAPSSDAKRFFTAYDIAVAEYFAQRLDFEVVAKLGTELVASKKMNKYFPDFSYCPTKTSDFNKVPRSVLSVVDIAVKIKIAAYCDKK